MGKKSIEIVFSNDYNLLFKLVTRNDVSKL